MYKILLLTDFSDASRHAISYTQALFADTAVDFCLLYACPIEPDIEYTGTMLIGERWKIGVMSLEELRLEMTQPSEPIYHTYRTLARMGEPVEILNQLLTKENEQFDLVVMGATGTGWSELLGSVATDVIRKAKTNTLVVPISAPIRPVEQLVLATDYRCINDTVSLGMLIDIASRKAALITLLTIDNPGQPETHVSDSSRQYVLCALENVLTATYIIHDDNVLHGINTYLLTHTVDLLVTLPHHKRIFDVLAHKSITRTIAFRPTVPLLALYDEEILDTQPTESSSIEQIPFATYL
ncbi:universal stress protein [Spirosoma aureum]|uniref:Universal stress protein n=1 Tax=Spirosoma aureum TaxID=2692134 RepID=A0A6G9ARP0_9BACT|nr:universal stress protein [Spirosoma aureum]QIP15141.1 universal stress protein [Spirosoma aureum]